MIVLNSEIEIHCCPPHVKAELINFLTITNPKYTNALSLNLNLYKIDPTLNYYSIDKNKDILRVPIGILPKVAQLLPNEQFIDTRLDKSTLKFPDIKFTGNLRDYQKDALDSLNKRSQGVISAMTGSGKTIIMIAHIVKQKRPTFILVNTNELAQQFKDRLKQFTDIKEEDIGFLGNGKKNLKPITICLLQTLVRIDEDILTFINNYIPQVICDETHIIAADTYYNASKNLTAKYKYGFSATPEREDGLTKVIHFAAGQLIHDVPKESLKDSLVMPDYKIIETNYFFPLFSTNDYQNMISDLALDRERNELILKLVEENSGKMIAILCDRALQVLFLRDNIPDSEILLSQIPEHNNYRPIYKNNKLVSKPMSKKDRQNVMSRLTTGKSKIIISTYGLMSTGIDLPNLEVLILASPIKSKVKIKQSIGRVMRKGDFNKSPIVIDLHDKKVDLLKYQALQRKRIIKGVLL